MEISLRSQIVAGTAAVVGAGAIAMTPVLPASLPSVELPNATVAGVTLAGFDSPVSLLFETLNVTGNYLFSSASPLNLAKWVGSGIAPGTGVFGGAWPAALLTDTLGGYAAVGLFPQIIDDALPIVRQLGFNGSEYLQQTIAGVSIAGEALSEGIWNGLGALFSLDIATAIDDVINGVTTAGETLLAAGQFVLESVIANATAVFSAVAESLPLLIGATIGQATVLVNAVIKPFTDAIDALSGPNPIEGVWNALVNGFVGPTGLPGTLLNLTIGAWVQTGPISGDTQAAIEASIAENFVPSVRTVVQGTVKTIATALDNVEPPPFPTAAVAPAPTPLAASAEAAGPVELSAQDVKADVAESAPVVDNTPAPQAETGSDTGGAAATAADDAPAPKAKQRVSRKAS